MKLLSQLEDIYTSTGRNATYIRPFLSGNALDHFASSCPTLFLHLTLSSLTTVRRLLSTHHDLLHCFPPP